MCGDNAGRRENFKMLVAAPPYDERPRFDYLFIPKAKVSHSGASPAVSAVH